jgi:glutaminase
MNGMTSQVNQRDLEIDSSPLLAVLKELHSQYKLLREGAVAKSIPELAKVNPDLFSICIVTVDGQIYKVGDFDQLFTIFTSERSTRHRNRAMAYLIAS